MFDEIFKFEDTMVDMCNLVCMAAGVHSDQTYACGMKCANFGFHIVADTLAGDEKYIDLFNRHFPDGLSEDQIVTLIKIVLLNERTDQSKEMFIKVTKLGYDAAVTAIKERTQDAEFHKRFAAVRKSGTEDQVVGDEAATDQVRG